MQFGSMNLFALSHLSPHAYSGYYMNRDGAVYSTKRGSTPVKMLGSGHGAMLTYTMNKRSVNGLSLVRQAQRHSMFLSETASNRPALDVVTERLAAKAKSYGAQRNHASNVQVGIASKGVVIARVAKHDGAEHLLFGSKPAIHTTEASYKDEMTRLAMQYPGTKFVALKIVTSVISGGVTWE